SLSVFATQRTPMSTLFPYTTLFRSLRAGAEPANRDALVEGKIVTVGSVHARDGDEGLVQPPRGAGAADLGLVDQVHGERDLADRDRKSTRLNSSHVAISYAVCCLKK